MKAGSAVTAGFFAAAVVEVRISGIGHLLRARVYALGVRILLVSQMYPGPDDPDLGVFVQQLEEELRRRGNEVEPAVIDHRGGGKRRYAALARRSLAASRRFRPDVVYAHFLVPTGLLAALGAGAARAGGGCRGPRHAVSGRTWCTPTSSCRPASSPPSGRGRRSS